jgi:ABC-type antimicrobial peptide transport system permease subunit
LIKAAGCPNGLVVSYFFTELLIVVSVGCLLGVVVGFASDIAVVNLNVFQLAQKSFNLWFGLLVFVAYFLLAIVFGAKPIFDASRKPPIVMLSPVQYFGLVKSGKFKPMSKLGMTIRIGLRGLYRRQSATIRVILFLSVVSVLLTVLLAGSLIAEATTQSWVERAEGRNVIAIGTNSVCNQYSLLYSEFLGVRANSSFDYSNNNNLISAAVLETLGATPGVANVDPRLLLYGSIQEIGNYTINPSTLSTIKVGDDRVNDSLIVGVDPAKVQDVGLVQGRFLRAQDTSGAVIGDSIANATYFSNSTLYSDPLLESIIVQKVKFNIVGTMVDPLNNGMVVYVPLESLQNATGIHNFNIVLVKLEPGVDRAATIRLLEENLKKTGSALTVLDLNGVLNANLGFLGSIWSAVMFLSLFTLASAVLCLTAYVLLSIEEQKREFAIFRATGAKPRTILSILSIQSLIILLSSFTVGISFGIILTLLILVPQPVVNNLTLLQVVAWPLAALVGMFLISLYPATRFSKRPLLEIME